MDTSSSTQDQRSVVIEHFRLIEQQLLAMSNVVMTSGHNLHKGAPREAFISEFLFKHLGRQCGIGTGEIIDRKSVVSEKRNQIDIVVHRCDYPRIHFGGNIDAYLAESVLAAIEVKSVITREQLKVFIETAKKLKGLSRVYNPIVPEEWLKNLGLQRHPEKRPELLTYVVSFDGPRLETIHSWIVDIYEELGVPEVKMAPSHFERQNVLTPALDGVFVLGRGFLHFDNSCITPNTGDRLRKEEPEKAWIVGSNDSLYFLFAQLSSVIHQHIGYRIDVLHYMPDGGTGSPVQLL